MNDLKSLVALQTRVCEFLEKQDEATLRAILAGTAQLAVLNTADASVLAVSAPSGSTAAPSRDPEVAAQHLSRLTSEHERREYIGKAGLTAEGLRRVAGLWRLRGYSKLAKTDLIGLVACHNLARADPPPNEPPPEPEPVDATVSVEQQAVPQETQPPATSATGPDADGASIAARLRETETEGEGAAYLRAQQLGREGLLAVAAELQLTRVNRLSQTELEKRILKQAIGARRKFAGLRKW